MKNAKPSVTEHYFSLKYRHGPTSLQEQKQKLKSYGFTNVCAIENYRHSGQTWQAYVATGSSEEFLVFKIKEGAVKHHYYFHT